MENKIKNGLMLLILGLLFLPLIQQEFRLIPEKKMGVDFEKQLYREFAWKDWWDGTFWNLRNQYIAEGIGFKSEFTKIYAQADYSLFKKTKLRAITGTDGQFFIRSFVLPYLGIEFQGRQAIIEKTRKLKAIQDTLSSLGKTFVFIQAPCRVSYYAEYLPKEIKDSATGINNYDVYARVADSMGVNFIDFNAWFLSMKNKSKDLLFTRESIHWSMYGSLIAADSMIRYLENKRHVHLVHPVWTKIEHTHRARYSDAEITKLMNLIVPLTNEVYSYPEVTYPSDATTVLPKVVYIGDSFLNNWKDSRFLDNTNINWELWFYFREIWDRYSQEDDQTHKLIAGYDWLNALSNADFVIMMYTTANDAHLGNGFIEQAYDHYFPAKKN